MLEPTKHKCADCGEDSENFFYGPDPFMDEIYPEEPNPDKWMCRDCYQSACEDI